MSKNKEKDDNLTVSKVYETLKSPSFLKDLYWDILSGLKEKKTYKLMKETSEKLINQKAAALDGLTDSESDNVYRKSIVTQICSMSYAIDTVYSKILYMKLEKACRSQIPIVIKELRNEGKISDKIWADLKLIMDISETPGSTENSKVEINSDKQKAKTPNETASTLGKRKRKATSTNEGDKKVSDMNYKDVMSNDAGNRKADLPKKKLGGRIQVLSKKNTSIPVSSTPKKKLTEENVSTSKMLEDDVTDIPKDLLQIDNQDSDADSEISVGHLSLASVSSVHTSDLSSFDDAISLSSEDEEDGKKRKLSLKDLQKSFCQNGNLSSGIAKKLNGTKIRKSPLSKERRNKKAEESEEQENEANTNKKSVKEQDQISSVDNAGSSSESVASQSPNEKGLSKRVRKPNSRYSSENILRTAVKVKERKRSVVAVKSTNEKNSTDELSPKKKKPKIETDDIDVQTPSETEKMEIEESNNDLDVKSPSKRYDSSDLYKPHSAVRSLTSRRTAPVTLYSTAT